MKRPALFGSAALALGGAATAWLLAGNLTASWMAGFGITFGVIELGTLIAHPESETYGPLNPLSVSVERALAAALFLLGWGPSFLLEAGLFDGAQTSVQSTIAYICGLPAGVAMFLFADSNRKRERRNRNKTGKFLA